MVTIFEVLGLVVLVYFEVLTALYVLFTVIAWRAIAAHLAARRYDAIDEALASPFTPPVSVLVPAFNEEAGIVESVRSLLALRYPEHEVIVVNDGSTDGTLAHLERAFDLAAVPKALRGALAYAPVRRTYVSRRHTNLTVVDKENGGKADALNCAIDAALYPFFCAVDADALLEEDALLRVAKPVLDDPDLVAATGGIVRIANGCVVDHGRVMEVRLPASRLATFQVVEYFRAFLVGRVGWSRVNALLIISGAFGLFRRDVVEAVGGYAANTVGEDVELVVRLHRYLRGRGEDYRITFIPDPVCWTEVPEDFRTLGRQRRRWQRGLTETLWRHRSVAFNPRYGTLGLFAVPYFLLFELLGPVVELTGYVVIPLAAAAGFLSMTFLLAFLVLAVFLGMLLSVSALAIEEFSFRRHPKGREIGRMLLFAALDNFGYRQLLSLFRALGLLDVIRRRRGWGEMRRRGFAHGLARVAGSPSLRDRAHPSPAKTLPAEGRTTRAPFR